MKADYDSNGLTSFEFARIYNSKANASAALNTWASAWDANALNEANYNYFLSRNFSETDARWRSSGMVVKNQIKFDMVHIVPIQMSFQG
jgi:hypothetical protein